MDATAPPRHTVQLAARLGGLAVFIGCTAVGIRHLGLESRVSPVDGVLWSSLVLLGLVLCALTVATMRNQRLLGLSPEQGTTVRRVPNALAIGLAGLSLVAAIVFHRWQVAAANALMIAAGSYYLGPRPQPAAPPAPVVEPPA